jgi:transcriptional regulator of arginine metabolism
VLVAFSALIYAHMRILMRTATSTAPEIITVPAASRTAARRLLLRRLLLDGDATTQRDLVAALARGGHTVTQTTVSRDLSVLGARKGDDDRYRLAPNGTPGPSVLAERMRQFVVEIDASANIVVLHTPPGSAHAVAVALDAARANGHLDSLLGTIAGDDTVLAISRAASGAARLKRKLERLMEV